MGRQFFGEHRGLFVQVLPRNRAFYRHYEGEISVIMVLLARNGPLLKPQHIETMISTGCPLPSAVTSVMTLVIDGEEGAKSFLAEVPRIVKAPVAVQGRDRAHFGLVQLKIK